jgi:hypothetical protein
LSFAVSAYRALLLAYPVAHRFEYGPLMVQLFRDRCRDVRRRKGMWGLVRLWGRVLVDTLVTAVEEHVDALKERSRPMTDKQRLLVGGCVVGPLALWGGLCVVNPQFASVVFEHPSGWIAVVAIVLLLVLCFFLQRWVFLRPVVAESAQVIADELTLRVLVLAGTIVCLVLPAVGLILFAPAAVTVATMMGQ